MLQEISIRAIRPCGSLDKVVAHALVVTAPVISPMRNREMWIGDEEELGFALRLLDTAELRQGRGQCAPRMRAIGRFVTQRRQRLLVVLARILCLAQQQVIPGRRNGIEPECLLDLLQAFIQPTGEYREVGHLGPSQPLDTAKRMSLAKDRTNALVDCRKTAGCVGALGLGD